MKCGGTKYTKQNVLFIQNIKKTIKRVLYSDVMPPL